MQQVHKQVLVNKCVSLAVTGQVHTLYSKDIFVSPTPKLNLTQKFRWKLSLKTFAILNAGLTGHDTTNWKIDYSQLCTPRKKVNKRVSQCQTDPEQNLKYSLNRRHCSLQERRIYCMWENISWIKSLCLNKKSNSWIKYAPWSFE